MESNTPNSSKFKEKQKAFKDYIEECFNGLHNLPKKNHVIEEINYKAELLKNKQNNMEQQDLIKRLIDLEREIASVKEQIACYATNGMNIYLVQQNWNNEKGVIKGFVAVAESESHAINMHPLGSKFSASDYYVWQTKEPNTSKEWVAYSDIKRLKVTNLGTANKDIEDGVILISYE